MMALFESCMLKSLVDLQHLHEVLTATEAGRDSDVNNSMENIMPRVKLIDASLKVTHLAQALSCYCTVPTFTTQQATLLLHMLLVAHNGGHL